MRNIAQLAQRTALRFDLVFSPDEIEIPPDDTLLMKFSANVGSDWDWQHTSLCGVEEQLVWVPT